jgi:hypothetical protein
MIGETDDALSWETKEFRKGYQNAIMQFQKKYNLRSKGASTEPQQTNPIRKPPWTPLPQADQGQTTRPRMRLKRQSQRRRPQRKAPETSREAGGKEVEKVCPPFNFEHEMAKIKILSLSMNLSERVSIGRKLLKC